MESHTHSRVASVAIERVGWFFCARPKREILGRARDDGGEPRMMRVKPRFAMSPSTSSSWTCDFEDEIGKTGGSSSKRASGEDERRKPD